MVVGPVLQARASMAHVLCTILLTHAWQPTVNASTGFMKMFVDGSTNDITDQVQNLVDVRDVATAHLAVLEKGDRVPWFVPVCHHGGCR
jgi:nucleoside-diphosphate-sugar epimerase